MDERTGHEVLDLVTLSHRIVLESKEWVVLSVPIDSLISTGCPKKLMSTSIPEKDIPLGQMVPLKEPI